MKLFRRHTQPSCTEKQQHFLALLEPIYNGLYRFIYALTRDRDKADDLMSETILQAYERFDTVKDTQAFFSFMLTIAKRIHRRLEWRARLFTFGNEEAMEQMFSNDVAPDMMADTRLMLDALDTLPEKQREALILFEISGFSIEEICAVQGGSLSGVKSRLVRGRQKLSRILGHTSQEEFSSEERKNIAISPAIHYSAASLATGTFHDGIFLREAEQ